MNKYYRKQNRYHNPYYKNQKKSFSLPKLNWRVKLIVFEVILLFGGLIWFFYFSTVYELMQVEVKGNGRINTSEIDRIIWNQSDHYMWGLFGQRNIFFLDEDKIKSQILEDYYLDSLSVSKELPGKMIIEMIEKEYEAIWCEENKCYYIDSYGHVLDEVGDDGIKVGYPMIEYTEGSRVYSRVVKGESERIGKIMDIFALIKAEEDLADVIISKFLLGASGTVEIELEKGPKLLFSIEEAIDNQIVKLITIKKEKIKLEFANKEYIDLRFGDRVYYR